MRRLLLTVGTLSLLACSKAPAGSGLRQFPPVIGFPTESQRVVDARGSDEFAGLVETVRRPGVVMSRRVSPVGGRQHQTPGIFLLTRAGGVVGCQFFDPLRHRAGRDYIGDTDASRWPGRAARWAPDRLLPKLHRPDRAFGSIQKES